MKPGETPGNVGLLTNKELSQMLTTPPPPLPGPNTKAELAREDPGEVVEKPGRDPAGRGKQAAGVIFTLLRPQSSPTASLQSRKFPWLRTKPRSLRTSGVATRGFRNSNVAAWSRQHTVARLRGSAFI